MSVTVYLDEHRDRQLSELVAFAAIPSVSALEEHRTDIERCARWLGDHLARIGLEHVELVRCGGNPIVYGDWLHAGDQTPTVLVYGHYDVQPADPFELWTSPPFEPTVREGHIYARGISDNKGQIFTALAGLEAALAGEGELPCNVKVIVEGEEELRADYLDVLMRDYGELLSADVLMNTDSTFLGPGQPSVPVGLRGMAALELTVTTGARDLHSGLFGGLAPNALQVMAAMLSSLTDGNGHVLVDGFYDDVRSVGAQELASWNRLEIGEPEILEQSGAFGLMAEPGFTVLERQWARPTLDVVGMWGGFNDQGLKTIIPAQAHAKISCRLVPDQGMDDVLDKLEAHLARVTPASARVQIDWRLPGAPAMLMPVDHPAVLAAQAALEEGFGSHAELVRLGASVPVNEIAQRNLGLEAVMLGFSSPTDAFHSPDERFALSSFDAGRATTVAFLRNYAERLRA